MRQINQAGLDLIKSFEGCKLTAYKDAVGVWTIGYGHTDQGVHAGETITQAQAEQLLKEDLQHFCDGVEELATAFVTDNQFAALVCFAYNVGLNNLKSSTLLRMVNEQDDGAADQFLKWNHAGGQVILGLTRRREAERQLFFS